MAGGAGVQQAGTSGSQQWNTGSNWAPPVQGTAWQNPTTSPMLGAPQGTGSMTGTPNTNVYKVSTSYDPYGNLNDPANAAGRRNAALAAAQQPTPVQDMSLQQSPQNLGMGGYGYGPMYGGGFGGMGGIAGLLGALGFGGYGGYGGRRFGPPQQTATATPPQGITSLTS